MLKKIIKGYGELFGSFSKILVLLLLCAGCGAAVVFPLWKFATNAPEAYTATILSLLAIITVCFIILKTKKNGISSSLIFIAKFFILAAGLALIYIFVISGLRILALPVILAMIFLYGILSFIIKKNQKKELQNDTDE